MSRRLFKLAALIQLAIILLTGCSPTQPFFVASDPARANYIAQSMDIEYADVYVESLPEATQASEPFGPGNLPENFVDLTLEDCVSMALNNSKILRILPGANANSGSVAAQVLSATPGQLPSVWDPATVATTASSQPLAVDGQGNRISSRSLIRANQVGGVEDALSEFDAQFSAIFGYNTTDRPRNVAPGNVFNPQFFQAVDANGQTALSKRLATGTVATARFTTVYSRNNIPTPTLLNPNNFGRNVPSDYTATFEMQVNQPLLRGRGTLVNRIPVVLARINEDLEAHQFEANVRNLVRDVEHAYWDLYCGYRAFEASKVAQASALDLWRVAEARTTRGGDTPPEAEAQARALFFQFRAQVHTSLYGSRVPGNDPGGLIGREAVLREKIGWGPTDGQLIRPADEPTIARVDFDWNSIRSEALTRNTELRRHKWAIKQRELELILARNHILPQFDLVTFYRWVGVGDHLAKYERTGINFPAAGSSALEELTGGDYQEVGVRAELTPHAFGKRRANANLASARIALTKGNAELQEKEIALMFQVSEAYRMMQSSFVSMQDYASQMTSTEDEIDVYTDKIQSNAGQLSNLLDNLLRAEERRSRAQLQYFQAVCEYNKSMVNVHYFKGSLLDLNGITLGEGEWVEKAYWDAEERSRERAAGIYFDYGYTRPAVVSNGPVQQGLLTEGSLPRPGSNSTDADNEETQSEEGEAEIIEGGSGDDVQPLPEAPAAGDELEMQPLPEDREDGPAAPITSANNRSAVRVATATSPARKPSSSNFQWGAMGLGDGEPAPIVPSGREIRLTPETDRQSNARVIRSSSADEKRSSNIWNGR
ncbi:MAG: TolC family protein [Planctomycetota bacterium]